MQRSTVLELLRSYISRQILGGNDADLDNTTPLLEWGIINSLEITRLLNFIRSEFQVEIPTEKLVAGHFETLDALTDLVLVAVHDQFVESSVIGTSFSTVAPVSQTEENFPSFGQQRLWFLNQLEPESTAYNEFIALCLKGELNVEALEQSINEIARRHEILRTTFPKIDGWVIQRIVPWQPVKLMQADLRNIPASRRDVHVRQLGEEEVQQPFALDRGPLMKSILYQLEDDQYLLLIIFHHLVVDGWSIGVFYRELATIYAAYCSKSPSLLPELPIQYADFASWQHQFMREEKMARHLAYWKKQLSGTIPVLELPCSHKRPVVQTYRGAHLRFELSASLSKALRDLARREGVTLFVTLLAAFQILLYRYTGQEDLLIGTPVANRNRAEFEKLIGLFMNMLVLRMDMSGVNTFHQMLERTRKVTLEGYAHQEAPFEQIVAAIQPQRDLSHSPLFQVMFNMQDSAWFNAELPGLIVRNLELESGSAKFDLTLSMVDAEENLRGTIEYNTDLFEAETIERLVKHLQTLLEGIVTSPAQQIVELPLLTEEERRQILFEWSNTQTSILFDECVHELFEKQVLRAPEAVAVVCEDKQLTYGELNRRANQLAHHLQLLGVGPDVLVALCVERSLEMVIGILGILKAGGAYIPLDPDYPQERLTFMLTDAQVRVVLIQQGMVGKIPSYACPVLCLDTDWQVVSNESQANPYSGARAENLAYTIYTSGSTGNPKGVMVCHKNVVNFFAGMDQGIGDEEPGVWLAITSISFDISVLEILWTLTRGFKVIIQLHQNGLPLLKNQENQIKRKKIDFSLFYFANNDETTNIDDKYRLLLEGARFADQHGFSAVWTPERHFHPFGGLYPNPSVTSAAIATITDRINIRAGSVVLPLHNPIRVAEEWSVVDNLSKGRAGISFATGWQVNDFVLAPENYSRRREIMRRGIETVRKLWRGEEIFLQNSSGEQVAIKIFPRPLQSEMPIWITTSGNIETFKLAGELGVNLLTHLLGQSIKELAEKIALYRETRRGHGYDPAKGQVALMLHTFIGQDSASTLEKVREPFLIYLKSSFDLMSNLLQGMGKNIALQDLTEDDIDVLLTYAFNRYYRTGALIGTPDTCLELVEQLREIGVDELACLIDFIADADAVLENLHYLNTVRERSNYSSSVRTSSLDYSLLTQMGKYRVTHLQCTPSLAAMLASDTQLLESLRSLRKLLLGGEALSPSLIAKLGEALSGKIVNMYGPTETTIWSTMYSISHNEATIPIGRPIVNTQVYILDKHLQPLPIGIPGELMIGGSGIARGYLHRPEVTAERFIPNPFSNEPGARLYKTGDLARYRSNGTIEYLGRFDRQVKVRGFRIELGEIEHVLNQHPAVSQSAVILHENAPSDQRLVAYITTKEQHRLTDGELRKYVQAKLPTYMLPAAFVQMKALPLTPNGKLDFCALSAMEEDQRVETFAPPRTSLERTLASLWAGVLGLDQVGIYDNFFELGGHSLLATQLISRISTTLQMDIPLRSLFEAPTVVGFIEYILEREIEQIDSSKHDRVLAEIEQLAVFEP